VRKVLKKFSQYRHGYTNVHICTWVVQDPDPALCGHLVYCIHCHILQEVEIRWAVNVVDFIIRKHCHISQTVDQPEEPHP